MIQLDNETFKFLLMGSRDVSQKIIDIFKHIPGKITYFDELLIYNNRIEGHDKIPESFR